MAYSPGKRWAPNSETFPDSVAAWAFIHAELKPLEHRLEVRKIQVHRRDGENVVTWEEVE